MVASVGAFAHVAADVPKIEALRRDPGPLPGRDLPASFLKHSDEQSVCGFAAVLEAIRESGQPIESFREWGVVAAPRFLGRSVGGAAISKFFDLGVRGISPHAIPQVSLHSLSGVISVGLGLVGPNLGAGGGANALAEGLLTAFTMLAENRLTGLWLVTTAWDREPMPQKNGRVVAEGQCHAVAMALSPVEGAAEGLCLTFDPRADQIGEVENPSGCGGELDELRPSSFVLHPSHPSVMSLAEALSRQSRAPLGAVLWRMPLDWGAEVTLAKQHSS
jgi:hypothetical protein